MPQRIQMTRQRPWRDEHPDAVIVARPSKWGNPFVVGEEYSVYVLDGFGGRAEIVIEDREDAVQVYRDWIEGGIALPTRWTLTSEQIRELAGRDLACWCPLDQPCHADVLLEIANS